MALVRHYRPSVRMEYEELDGLINVIDKMLNDDESTMDNSERLAFIGASITLEIIRHHEYVEYPHQFVDLFKRYLDTEKGGE